MSIALPNTGLSSALLVWGLQTPSHADSGPLSWPTLLWGPSTVCSGLSSPRSWWEAPGQGLVSFSAVFSTPRWCPGQSGRSEWSRRALLGGSKAGDRRQVWGVGRRSPIQAAGFASEGSGDRGLGPPQPSRLMGTGPPSSYSCHTVTMVTTPVFARRPFPLGAPLAAFGRSLGKALWGRGHVM